ncbi:PKD domain-containing protein [Fulvivirga sp. 29W222]|uniref:PKD domain-containing protein n=1 Tax=Fulvivirga marina TaxID=2494733 RepID=A0A937KAM5_9BACT|nr:PKD domain-containing protein [Fulvivirga marina]MBL6444737.1 PKD domain-containing protein [Fulvivirga marina]
MKTLIINFKWILALLILVTACDPYGEEDLELGPPPTAEDAVISMTANAENANIIHFKNASSAFLKVWDFGNGSGAKGDDVTGIFPLKGTYEVTLTVYTSGGSISSSTTVEIAETNPLLLDIPVYNMLTGGADAVDGKTWVIDATRSAHFGVGPNPSDPAVGDYPNWYAAGINEKAGAGLYNDKFTFKLDGFSFAQKTDGDVFINTLQAGNFPGAFENAGDYTAPYTAPDNLTWSVSEDTDGNQVINIKNGGFIGYFTGTYNYQIVSLEENELFIRYEDTENPELAWYQRLVPEGFTAPPPPPPAVSSLPVDFEGALPPFNGFGGSTYQVIDNPDASGINTSAKVGEYVKGTDGNWAGIETALDAKIDFSTLNLIKYKVYSPVAGKALFKLESVDGSATPVEVFADVTKVNEWEELIFDFSGTASNTYDKIAIFLDFDNNNGGTFYIDDIRQSAEEAVLTEEALTGGSSKIWRLKPAAGAFGVGPNKGSDAWFPNGADISGDRPCLFNDLFIFKTGSVYEYDAQGDIYGESYMGLSDGCQNESNLIGTDAEPWASGTHIFSLTPATETDPAYITVTGTGAFIALPKAYNGGEYSAAPPTTDASVVYEVLSYVNNGTTETLSITIDIAGDGSAFWSFVLVAE